MPPIEFYEQLEYDFSIHEENNKLHGLTIGGFYGSEPLDVKEFNELELKAARDIIACYLNSIKSINKDYSSYGLKHMVERALKKETNNKINYISNGTLILAMVDAGYSIKRCPSTPNCCFNVSKKSIEKLRDFANNTIFTIQG